MLLKHQTWSQVEIYLKNKRTIIQPIGSTEQHGPTALIGTDYLTANALAKEVGEKTDTLVAPPLCIGMAEHHLEFPGTLSLRPSTYNLVILDLLRCYKKHGFQNIFFLNGHGGNTIPLQNAFCEWKAQNDELDLTSVNWWHMPEVREYENENFGDQNGFHATCGEVALTMFTDEKAFENIEKINFKVDYPDYKMPMSAKDVKKTFPDGRMYSNPGLSTKEHGKKIFDIASLALIKIVKELEK